MNTRRWRRLCETSKPLLINAHSVKRNGPLSTYRCGFDFNTRNKPLIRISSATDVSVRVHRRCSVYSSSKNEGGKTSEAIIVLAGGLKPDGSVPEWVEGRLDAARQIHAETGNIILCTGGGTPHKPPILLDNGHIWHESTVCAQYLLDLGVKPETLKKILKEISSFDTIGNAYFSLAIHAIPLQWRKVTVITSEFHMARSRAAFDWIYNTSDIELQYVSVPNKGMDEEALQARRVREEESAKALKLKAKELCSLEAIHRWLHETHRCYSVSRQHEWKEPTEADSLALKTY